MNKGKLRNVRYVLKLVSTLRKWYLFAIPSITIVLSLMPYLSILILQRLINTIQISNFNNKLLSTYLFCYLVINVTTILLTNISNHLIAKYKEYLYFELNRMSIKQSANYELIDYENPKTYDVIQKCDQVIGVTPFNILFSINNILSSVIGYLTAGVVLFKWHKWTIISMLTIPLLSINYYQQLSKDEYAVLSNRVKYERKSWYIAQLLMRDNSIKEIKTLNLFDYLYNEFSNLRGVFFRENVRINKKKTIFSIIYQLGYTFVSMLFLVIAFIEASNGKILLGDLTVYINLISKTEKNIKQIFNALFSIYKESLYSENIYNYFKKDKIYNSLCDKIKINKIDSIEFKNVSFRYPTRSDYALRNVTFKIKAGEKIAIVGTNGSGKTTLIKLMCKLYTNYEGDILINGINLKDINDGDIFRLMSVVYQDFLCYQFTIKENIGFGKIDDLTNFPKIVSASKKSSAHDFVVELPNQYNQQVGYWFENGTQLSGGQWQKLATARAFMKAADVYILDEPTSAFDTEAEYKFFSEFDKNVENKIGIFITHRFSNAKFANRIFILKHGTIICEGNHEELLESSEEYRRLSKIII